MSDTEPQPKPVHLSRETRVTVGVVISAAVVVLGALGILDRRFAGIVSKVETSAADLSEIKFSVRTLERDFLDYRTKSEEYVSRERVRSWAELVQAKNPDLDIPAFPQ